jgi:hypothetical protein
MTVQRGERAAIAPHGYGPPEARDSRLTGAGQEPALATERIALVDLLDRVLAGGVVVAGEVTLSIADVDMVTVSLRALITSVSALADRRAEPMEPDR